MANLDLRNSEIRKLILKDIKSNENIKRKSEAFADYEIFNDRLLPYVKDQLCKQLGDKSAAQMPIVSTLNVGKYVTENEATIYTNEPERDITTATKADAETCEKLYEEMQFDTRLQKSNKWFKYRGQSLLQVVPKKKSLQLRVVLAHNVDVIPDADDPCLAYAIILSTFDKSQYLKAGQDSTNELTADQDDYKKSLERYVVWTAEMNFIMDGNGKLIGDAGQEIVPNPIQRLPFVDIAKDKDYEYFVRVGQLLSDFTLQYNVAWSDALYINRMQGFSIGVLKGDPNLKPDTITLAPMKLLFLPSNPNNPESKLDLSFVNPTPNIEAGLKVIKDLLANFMMMRGVESKKVASALAGSTASYSSAIERLLAMIDEFEATKEDFSLYQCVEKELFDIIKKFLVAYTGTPFLDPKYNVSQSFKDAEIEIKFHEPQMIQTEGELLDNSQKEIDLGIADRVSILMKLEKISEEDAVKMIAAIDKRKAQELLNNSGVNNDNTQTQNNQNGS